MQGWISKRAGQYTMCQLQKIKLCYLRTQTKLCVAHKVCSDCFDTELTHNSTCHYCGQNEQVFTGINTVDEFCKWLFSGENNDATVLCHIFKGYDSFPILQYLFKNAIIPKIIPWGANNMSVEVPACNIRMIDSMNFLPSALSELPKIFGLKEMAKGFFPHLYNKKENQGIRFYNSDSMTTDPNKANNRKSFLQWYDTHQNDAFDFNVELLKYCRSNVDILRRCSKFRYLFMDITSDGCDDRIDPFASCITIASACNLVFRKNFLEHQTIGIIPVHGYRPEEKHSIKALKWIRYMANTKEIHIQCARNGGEKKIGEYV